MPGNNTTACGGRPANWSTLRSISQLTAAIIIGSINTLCMFAFVAAPLVLWLAWRYPYLVIPPAIAYYFLRWAIFCCVGVECWIGRCSSVACDISRSRCGPLLPAMAIVYIGELSCIVFTSQLVAPVVLSSVVLISISAILSQQCKTRSYE